MRERLAIALAVAELLNEYDDIQCSVLQTQYAPRINIGTHVVINFGSKEITLVVEADYSMLDRLESHLAGNMMQYNYDYNDPATINDLIVTTLVYNDRHVKKKQGMVTALKSLGESVTGIVELTNEANMLIKCGSLR